MDGGSYSLCVVGGRGGIFFFLEVLWLSPVSICINF